MVVVFHNGLLENMIDFALEAYVKDISIKSMADMDLNT